MITPLPRLTSEEARSRVERLWEMFDPCILCPRRCGASRRSGQIGVCGAGPEVRVAAWHAHRGEEPPLSGSRGSGTIFSAHCPMKCLYCQNFPFSQLGNGLSMSTSKLSDLYILLNEKRVHNLNFVTGTHFAPHLFEALGKARESGVDLPVVWNTSGYETVELLRVFEGLVDIYLPDIRYADNAVAMQLSKVPDYVEVDRAALLEMYRQVGPLVLDADEIAVRGMIVRHLVLPGGLAGTRNSLTWLRDHIGTEVFVSLMCQYFPAHQAHFLPGLDRRLPDEEYRESIDVLEELGFENAWAQDPYEAGCA